MYSACILRGVRLFSRAIEIIKIETKTILKLLSRSSIYPLTVDPSNVRCERGNELDTHILIRRLFLPYMAINNGGILV